MSWYSRTWCICGSARCEAEVLRTRAEAAGWLLREGRAPLCPMHRGDVRELDAAERAAGEQGDK